MLPCPQVSDVVKEVCSHIKQADEEQLPLVYLAALQAAFMQHVADDASQHSWDHFLELSRRVAHMYTGFNKKAQKPVLQILQVGLLL